MPMYVIEREMPGIGQLSAAELQAVSENSRVVLKEMGPKIRWIESYVTNDKLYSVFLAQNENLLRQHARQAGFPVTKISEVYASIGPTLSAASSTDSTEANTEIIPAATNFKSGDLDVKGDIAK